MIQQIVDLISANKAHSGAYALIVIAGISGYTNLTLELGELRATDRFQAQMIDSLAADLNVCENRIESQ